MSSYLFYAQQEIKAAHTAGAALFFDNKKIEVTLLIPIFDLKRATCMRFFSFPCLCEAQDLVLRTSMQAVKIEDFKSA